MFSYRTPFEIALTVFQDVAGFGFGRNAPRVFIAGHVGISAEFVSFFFVLFEICVIWFFSDRCQDVPGPALFNEPNPSGQPVPATETPSNKNFPGNLCFQVNVPKETSNKTGWTVCFVYSVLQIKIRLFEMDFKAVDGSVGPKFCRLCCTVK